MPICLATHNLNKVTEFKRVLEPAVIIEHLDIEYPELRSDDPEEVVRVAALALSRKLDRPVLVEDSGLFIDALAGFPGTCTAYVFSRIGNAGILKLMKGVRDRRCWYKSAVGYCEPGGEPKSFLGVEEGSIAQAVRGKHGWGQDPIFIPKGSRKTYGECRKPGDVNVFRHKALSLLKAFLAKR